MAGQHHRNPMAKIAALPRPAEPEFRCQSGLQTTIELKPGILVIPIDAEIVELDGTEWVKGADGKMMGELPKEHGKILHEGDRFEDVDQDLVVRLSVLAGKTSVLLPGGQVPGTQICGMELLRLDWSEVRKTLDGEKPQPPVVEATR